MRLTTLQNTYITIRTRPDALSLRNLHYQTMLTGIKTQSAPSMNLYNVYAAASELKTQLQALEERRRQNESTVEQLKMQRLTLQDELAYLRVVEDEETKATKELQRELEKVKESDLNSLSFTFEFIGDSGQYGYWIVSRRTHGIDLVEGDDGKQPEKGSKLLTRNVIPESWKQATRNLIINPREYARMEANENRTTTKDAAAKARMMRRVLSDKVKQKAASSWKARQHQTRRTSKTSHTVRKQTMKLT